MKGKLYDLTLLRNIMLKFLVKKNHCPQLLGRTFSNAKKCNGIALKS